MEFSKMTEYDIKDVAHVFMTSFNHVGEQWTFETALAHVSQNFFGNAHWVAKENDKIVGFIMGIILTREHGTELFIDSVAVLPEYRGRRVGSGLWSLAEQYVSEQKLHGIRLLANQTLKSFEWYTQMGFTKSGWVELEKSL